MTAGRHIFADKHSSELCLNSHFFKEISYRALLIVYTALLEKKEKEEEMELIPHEIQITAEKIKKHTFPIYVPPNVKDDMVRFENGYIK